MAFVTTITCSVCGETKPVTFADGDYHTVCNDCTNKERIQKRTIYLNGLTFLSVEERLRKIEEMLYDRNE